MANRIIRTKAQQFADNEKKQAQLKQSAIDSALRLREQAAGWIARSKELVAKAEGASAKADAELKDFGIDPVQFWAEHDKNKGGE